MARVPRIPIVVFCVSIQQGIATATYTLNHTGTVCNCCNIFSGNCELKHKDDNVQSESSSDINGLYFWQRIGKKNKKGCMYDQHKEIQLLFNMSYDAESSGTHNFYSIDPR